MDCDGAPPLAVKLPTISFVCLAVLNGHSLLCPTISQPRITLYATILGLELAIRPKSCVLA